MKYRENKGARPIPFYGFGLRRGLGGWYGYGTHEIRKKYFPHNPQEKGFLSNRQHLAPFGCMVGARWVTAPVTTSIAHVVQMIL